MARRATPLLAGLALVGSLAFAVATGVPLGSAALAVAFVAAQGWAGAYLWRVLIQRAAGTSVELLGMGIAVGSLMGVVGAALLLPVAPAWIGGLVPAAAVSLVAAVRRLRGHRLPRAFGTDGPTLVALGVGVLVGGAALALNLRNYPLAWSGTRDSFHPDMVFFEALSRSVAAYGNSDSIFMSGGHIRYHWLAYGWAGQLTEAGHLPAFAALTRVVALAAVVGAAALAAAWARRLTSVPWVPTLAVVLVMAGGYVGAVYGTLLNVDSPSQSMATVWLLAVSLVMLLHVSRGLPRPAMLLVALLAAGCTGGKVSAAAVALGGIGLTALVGLVRREAWGRRALEAAIAAGAGAGIAYVALLWGSASSGDLLVFTLSHRASSVQGLDVSVEAWGAALGTAVLLLAVVPRWSGLAVLLARPQSRWQPETWLGVGAGSVAVLALAVLAHGVNDLWFSLSASTPLAVLSAVGVGAGVEELGSRKRRAIGAAAAGAGVFVMVALIWRTGVPFWPSWRWTAPITGVVGALIAGWLLARGAGRGRRDVLILVCVVLVSAACFGRLLGFVSFGSGPPQPAGTATTGDGSTAKPSSSEMVGYLAWGDDERQAADALTSVAAATDIIATDQVNSSLVPALTGLRTYLTGELYQAFIGTRADSVELERRRPIAEAIAAGPSPDVTTDLCAAGVTWIWTTPAAANSWAAAADPVYTGERVAVLRLARSVCA
jgi:hypothetical protein